MIPALFSFLISNPRESRDLPTPSGRYNYYAHVPENWYHIFVCRSFDISPGSAEKVALFLKERKRKEQLFRPGAKEEASTKKQQVP